MVRRACRIAPLGYADGATNGVALRADAPRWSNVASPESTRARGFGRGAWGAALLVAGGFSLASVRPSLAQPTPGAAANVGAPAVRVRIPASGADAVAAMARAPAIAAFPGRVPAAPVAGAVAAAAAVPAAAASNPASAQPTARDRTAGAMIAPPAADDQLERIGLDEAVSRALARNPSAVVAAQDIARTEALVREARAGSFPTLTANGTVTRLDADRAYGGRVVAARDQLSGNLQLTVPIIAPQRWVQWSHASTNVDVARASAADVRRQVALAAARAYLAVVAQKRQVDINERARETARAHAEFAHTRLTGGVGNRLDDVRAAQQLAATDSQLASSYAALARTREALGVMLGSERPLDANVDVKLPEPPSGESALDEARSGRADIAASRTRVGAAEQLKRDSWVDFMPSLTGQVQPFYQHPETMTVPTTGWQALLLFSWPLYDGGLRYGQRAERTALLEQARVQYDGLVRQSKSDVRAALETARRAEEALAAAVDAAELSHQALQLTTLAYEAGARTNIEVIDAERQARDADTSVAMAEDSVRQARLDLLVAAGRFPSPAGR